MDIIGSLEWVENTQFDRRELDDVCNRCSAALCVMKSQSQIETSSMQLPNGIEYFPEIKAPRVESVGQFGG